MEDLRIIYGPLIGVIGVIIGWSLTQLNNHFADRKNEKKKLKKLLYNLLALRFILIRDIQADANFNIFIDRIKQKVPEIASEKLIELKPIILKSINNNSNESSKIEYLEANIQTILLDVAEFFPVFAYELDGQFNITSVLKRAENSMMEFGQEFNPDASTNPISSLMTEILKPVLSDKLMKRYDEHLEKIALKVGGKMAKEIKLKIAIQNGVSPESIEAIDKLIDLMMPWAPKEN